MKIILFLFGGMDFFSYLCSRIKKGDKDMITLEEILQKYFNCKRPFNKNEKLSESGWSAYGKLTKLVYDLGALGVIEDANDVVESLDHITGEIG